MSDAPTRKNKAKLADMYADEMMAKATRMQENGESVGIMVRNIAWHYAMANKTDTIAKWLEMRNLKEGPNDG